MFDCICQIDFKASINPKRYETDSYLNDAKSL